MAASKSNSRVVIVGAGPVGMVCALALNKRGVSVTVFEQEPAPVEDQRAASLHPSTLEMLDDLGVTEKIIPLGLISSAYRFHDRVSHSVVAEFDLGLMKDEIPLSLRAAIRAVQADGIDRRRIRQRVRFRRPLRARRDRADADRRTASRSRSTSPAGIEKLRADYVIGCDGGRSIVRKLAGIEFEGFTYPERFIKIATSFDFGVANPKVAFRNYFSDPAEWCNLFKVQGKRPPGLWRAIMPIQADETDEIALSPERDRGAPAEVLSQQRPLRDRIRQRLRRAPVRRGDLPQGPRAARRRQRPRQQSDRRHGHERRHPRRHQSRRQARAA